MKHIVPFFLGFFAGFLPLWIQIQHMEYEESGYELRTVSKYPKMVVNERAQQWDQHEELILQPSIVHKDEINIDSICDIINDPTSHICKIISIESLKKVAKTIEILEKNPSSDSLTKMGNNWGAHFIKDANNSMRGNPCIFYSYGISNDWSFDSDLSSQWKCTGFLLDPTVVHSSNLQPPNLYFLNFGAPLIDSGNAINMISPQQLMKALGHKYISILKMDCEGCEYAMARESAMAGPEFWNHIGQLAIEVHLSKVWAKDDLHVVYIGLLFDMLYNHGFDLIHSYITGCHPLDEEPGCGDLLKEAAFPCSSGRMCHNYLFAK